jgi:hypothetical protein
MTEYAFQHKDTKEFVCTGANTGALLLAMPDSRLIDRVIKFPTLNDAIQWLRNNEALFVMDAKKHKADDKYSIFIDDLVFVSIATTTLSPNLRLLLRAGKANDS